MSVKDFIKKSVLEGFSPYNVPQMAGALLAVAASAVMIGVVVFLSRWQTAGRSYVAVLHYQGEKPGDEIVRALGRNKFAVKSKTLRAEGTELAVEVCCRDNASEVTDRLRSIEGVEDVTMIQYNGEYHG